MAAGLAHEIKNPLSTMLLNLQMMEEDFAEGQTELETRTLRRARLLLGEVRRLDSLVRDFLDLARGVEVEPRAVDTELLLTDLMRFTEPENERLAIQVRTSFDSRARYVLADPQHLRTGLVNLMVNAQQAMEQEGGELFLETQARPEERLVEIRVTDTGPGIAPDVFEKIFMPFWSSKAGGTGLGLPTTRRILEEMGGDLRVQSAPGRGTRFIVELPMVPMALPSGSDMPSEDDSHD